MGGGAGDQIQHPQALQAPKAWQQFSLAMLPIGNQGGQGVAEVLGRCPAFGGGQLQQLDAKLQPGQKTAVQLLVCQQGEQGWREAEGEPGSLLRIGGGRLQHLQQGQITLLQGLVVPVLLQGPRLP